MELSFRLLTQVNAGFLGVWDDLGMNTRTLAIASLVLWLVTAGVAIRFFVFGTTTVSTDNRREVGLTAGERDMVLGEMRTMLASVNGVLDGLSRNDRQKMQASATGAGMGMAVDATPGLMAKLPLEFKQMGMDTHRSFDALAESVTKGADDKQVIQALTAITARCVGCHAGYRLSASNDSAARAFALASGPAASWIQSR